MQPQNCGTAYMAHRFMYAKVAVSFPLTHCGGVTHICADDLTIIGSDNEMLLTEHLRTNQSAIPITIHKFSFKKIYLKMTSAKWWPFCLGAVELTNDTVRVYECHQRHHLPQYKTPHPSV